MRHLRAGRVRVSRLGQALCDDQVGNVELVLQQVGNLALYVLLRAIGVRVEQNLVERRAHHILGQLRIVAAHRLESLAVEIVVLLRGRPERSRVPLFVHQQQRQVDLFKLELNGRDEQFLGDRVGTLLSELDGSFHVWAPKLDKDAIRVAVDAHGIPLVPILPIVGLLGILL